MTTAGQISWSTDRINPAARLSAWRTFVSETLQQCDMDYSTEGDFWARMSCGRYGEIGIGKIQGSRRKGVRSAERAKITQDGVTLSIACNGRYSLSQARHENLLETGGAHFFHNCLPGIFHADEGGEYWLITMPSKVIVPRFGDSSSLIGCRIAESKPELRLLTAYLNAVYQTSGLDDANTKAVIGTQVTDMVVAAIGCIDEAAQANAGRGVRAARFKLVQEEIRKRYNEPMLNGDRIARAVGLSTRYVQQLFEENGRTLSSEIINERLRAARRELADPGLDGDKISDIAYRCGFSDLSHFNRAFRQKYGETPKGVRGTGLERPN
jgi:AraC-like DNA-binding protein